MTSIALLDVPAGAVGRRKTCSKMVTLHRRNVCDFSAFLLPSPPFRTIPFILLFLSISLSGLALGISVAGEEGSGS